MVKRNIAYVLGGMGWILINVGLYKFILSTQNSLDSVVKMDEMALSNVRKRLRFCCSYDTGRQGTRRHLRQMTVATFAVNGRSGLLAWLSKLVRVKGVRDRSIDK